MGKRAPLRMQWSKRERDYEYVWDRHAADGHWLAYLVNYGARAAVKQDDDPALLSAPEVVRRLRAELDARGFDPDTLVIRVMRKRDHSPDEQASADNRADTGSDGEGA